MTRLLPIRTVGSMAGLLVSALSARWPDCSHADYRLPQWARPHCRLDGPTDLRPLSRLDGPTALPSALPARWPHCSLSAFPARWPDCSHPDYRLDGQTASTRSPGSMARPHPSALPARWPDCVASALPARRPDCFPATPPARWPDFFPATQPARTPAKLSPALPPKPAKVRKISPAAPPKCRGRPRNLVGRAAKTEYNPARPVENTTATSH